MDKNKPHILCTAPLGQSLIDNVKARGIDLDIVPLIAIKTFSDKALEVEIISLFGKEANVVFTSNNAVKAVAGYKNSFDPSWKIFCIGNSTKKLVSENFGADKIKGTADNASELANAIIRLGDIKEIVFFCGDIHRDELSEKLKAAGISVHEIVVYKTLVTPQRMSKDYDAVLFFSPSAVNSFFELNQADNKTVFFAIGKTTASVLCGKTSNVVVTGDKPGKEELVELAAMYFQNKTLNV